MVTAEPCSEQGHGDGIKKIFTPANRMGSGLNSV